MSTYIRTLGVLTRSPCSLLTHSAFPRRLVGREPSSRIATAITTTTMSASPLVVRATDALKPAGSIGSPFKNVSSNQASANGTPQGVVRQVVRARPAAAVALPETETAA